ncbi:aldo/keto reductase [Streptomyces sp. SID3343]|uniref:aldo/keto reductase n=1 Tax=Streptomyces sp. SID3343 TaxID=2690260 RepID=UPI00136F8EAA|nr:aldo/keto reductase [Streptomyces sp. SID3343]MYW00142.1 aldo/keto reductase [Streptomyces sp. SID3343]
MLFPGSSDASRDSTDLGGSVGSVPRRRLGAHGPEVPVLALGSWNTWDRMSMSDAAALIRDAVDHGVELFDVAHYNMGPHAENARTDIVFGQAVRAAGLAREDYLLCGKLWLWEYPRAGFAEQLDVSLTRIGTDRADLVVVGDFFGELDVPAVVTDVAEQIAAGRFTAWGVNNWPAEDILRAQEFAAAEGLTAPTFAQLKYSLARRAVPEGESFAQLFADGLGMQASDVMEGGILAGNLYPQRKIGADPDNIRDRIRDSYPLVARIAAEFDATPAQLAIAFCLTNPTVANVLFGASRPSQWRDNLAALDLLSRHANDIRTAVAEAWVDAPQQPTNHQHQPPTPTGP